MPRKFENGLPVPVNGAIYIPREISMLMESKFKPWQNKIIIYFSNRFWYHFKDGYREAEGQIEITCDKLIEILNLPVNKKSVRRFLKELKDLSLIEIVRNGHKTLIRPQNVHSDVHSKTKKNVHSKTISKSLKNNIDIENDIF